MKIWYLSAYDQPNGHSSRTFWFASEFAKRGHDVTMLTNDYCHFTHTKRISSKKKWSIEIVNGVKIIWLNTISYNSNFTRTLNMLQNAYRCVQFARYSHDIPDIVIGPSVPILTGWAANYISKLKGSNFIYEIRDIWPQALVDLGKIKAGGIVEKFFKNVEKSLYHKSVHIVSALPYAYLHIEKYGIDKNKISWVPNGVDLQPFNEFPDYNGGTRDFLTILYLGRFAAGHDVDTIVEAAKILNDQYIDKLKFVFVGDGPYRERCLEKIKCYHLENISLYPIVPKSEVALKCSQADVLVASIQDISIFKFGINLNKLYDYFASGRPIILSANVPNDPVTEANAGVRITAETPQAMADAIVRLLNLSPDERAILGKNAKSYAEKFYDKCLLAEKYEKILLNLKSDLI